MESVFKIGKTYSIGNGEQFKVLFFDRDEIKGIFYRVEGLAYMFCTEDLLELAFKHKQGLHYADDILSKEMLKKFIK